MTLARKSVHSGNNGGRPGVRHSNWSSRVGQAGKEPPGERIIRAVDLFAGVGGSTCGAKAGRIALKNRCRDVMS